jgi:hypothetical protein
MPASPISKKLESYPARWKWKQKIILSDDKTHHYYSVDYQMIKKGWRAHLICCPLEDSPAILDNWYQVEELVKEHRSILDTIEMVFDISFEEKIIDKELLSE